MFFVVLSMLLQAGAVAYGNHADHVTLQNALATQEPAVEEIERVRKQLNGIAGKTLQLAQKGNANAARIVEQLKAAGVNLSTSDGSPSVNP